ncbi:uncharacterized protein dsx-c73A isoform X2 [Eurosta solidaginis]|uniref:uncharacterized protein dsx-c73A isoform X2 n=1 Tax=Eurosta solidaginis TaxID=178769 RepID=UPI00353108E3
MFSLRICSIAWLSIAFGLINLLQFFSTISAEYPDVIELVGYSNRRARTHYMPIAADNPTQAPPAAKMQADIETVKANIEKYNKLLTLDTKNLPESQKDMLERIVERVARLKESLDINDSERLTAAVVKLPNNGDATASTHTPTDAGADIEDEIADAKTTSITTEVANKAEAETDSTLVLDETTLLQLQTSMDELAAVRTGVTAQTAIARELPAATTTDYNFNDVNAERTESGSTDGVEIGDTTENLMTAGGGSGSSPADYYPSTTIDALTDATDADDQFVAARSNNRLAAASIKAESEESNVGSSNGAVGLTTIGSQRTLTTSGKLTKTRATKRPNSAGITKVGSSTVKRGQKPQHTTSGGQHRHTATNRQKLVTTTTTIQPAQAYQQLQQQQLQKLQQQKLQQQLALEKQQQQLLQQQQQLQQLQYQKSQLTQLPQSASSPSLYQTHNNNNKVSLSSPTPLTADKSSSAAATASTSSTAAASASPSSSSSYTSTPITTTLANNYGAPSNDMDYEPQVNTSALIDSLNAREEFYQQKQQIGNKDKKPSATAKPTKYHYYPHNQHIYLLPECAIQQVCNAVYVRLNYTQPLCACPSRYRDPCSASLNEDDQHTTKLVGDSKKKAITLAKTCEATTEMRECSSPKDWSLLALQNIRTGKSHYLIICRCPDHFKMEGPMAHDQPKYASVPGIRVFGMMCVKPGYSVRKPSSQPPKRYQLQKPFYRPNTQSNSAYINVPQYGGAKDSYGRPSSSSSSYGGTSASQSSSGNYHGENGFANQHTNNGGYQYLNRPDSNNNINPHQALSIGNYRPDALQSINNFQTGIYGRNNERKGETPIEAIKDDEKLLLNTSAQQQQQQSSAETMPPAAAAAGAGVDGRGIEETTANANFDGDFVSTASQHEQSGEAAPPRQKRSLVAEKVENNWDDYAPDFPWGRAVEFQQTIVWD